ncbi:MAG: hypothetical protein R3A52_21150 [Polyangiales bacterium]
MEIPCSLRPLGWIAQPDSVAWSQARRAGLRSSTTGMIVQQTVHLPQERPSAARGGEEAERGR